MIIQQYIVIRKKRYILIIFLIVISKSLFFRLVLVRSLGLISRWTVGCRINKRSENTAPKGREERKSGKYFIPEGRYQRKRDSRGWFIHVTGQLGNSAS